MRKFLKIVLIILLVLAVAAIGLLVYLKNKPAVPSDYQAKTQTGGPIEAKYLQNGSDEVAYEEQPVLQSFQKYEIYYPASLDTTQNQYPVIVLSNGSGTPLSKYSILAKHYASWGFIVIGTEENYAWNGFADEMCVRHLQRLNTHQQLEKDKPNRFYQKIDLDRVGIVGHSQGAVGVFNALTAQKSKEIYKAAAALSPTNMELAQNLEWEYEADQVQTPILLISGAGGGDDWVVTGSQLEEIYNKIPASRIMMRRKETGHNEVLYKPDGYVTAWFLWLLQDNQEASKAFAGPNAEILANTEYQDQKETLQPLNSIQ